MTTEEMCEIMKAYIEGKHIEYRRTAYGPWRDAIPRWDWNRFEYRVKPEAAEPSYSIDDVTGELKAKTKSLRDERHEMASAVSSAVKKELMTSSALDYLRKSNPSYAIADISELVEKKILDYKPEDKPGKQVRRMTTGELAKWCATGKGLFKNTDTNMTYTYVAVDSDKLNEPVGEWILIRGWDDPDWREALVDE